MKPLIYVASSWKNNDRLTEVHQALQRRGMDTWDFRNNGFWWSNVDPEYLTDPFNFVRAPESIKAFEYDKTGLDTCDGVFVLMPCGVATALEAGYATGRGKPVVVYGTARDDVRLDIMWRFATNLLPEFRHSLEAAVDIMKSHVFSKQLARM